MSDSPASARPAGPLFAVLGLWALALGGSPAAAQETGAEPDQAPMHLVPSESPRIPEAGQPDSATSATAGIIVPTLGGIEVNPLGEIAPDSVGVLDPADGGFGVDMWRGTDRYVVTSMLPRLPGAMRSRAMRTLARRLLLSAAAPPGQSAFRAGAEAPSLLALRVDRLAALGEVTALNRLLAVVPSRHDDEFLARTRIEALLLGQDSEEACRLVRNGVATWHTAPFWQKALVFCQLRAGEREKMMLGLDLLREQGAGEDAAFFQLAGYAFGVEANLDDDLRLAPLHLALLQVTGQPVPAGAVEHAGPGLLFALARMSSIELELRGRAAEAACAMGLLDGEALAKIYADFAFAPEDLSDAISAAERLDGPRARALLYQAARDQTLPTTRAEVLRVALQHAERAGLYQAAVLAFLPLLSEIDAVPELTWFATTAGRALYAAGHFEQASAWLMLGRQEAILNPQAATAVAALWPYSRLAGGDSLTTDGSLAAWRATREGLGDDALGRRQALLRASFQALGEPDPLAWSAIAAAVESPSRPLPSAALLYALQDASESRRLGETVLLSLVVLGEAGPAESHTLALSAVLSALGRVGLEREARSLAIEAALANGV